jgi:hypothetical protein
MSAAAFAAGLFMIAPMNVMDERPRRIGGAQGDGIGLDRQTLNPIVQRAVSRPVTAARHQEKKSSMDTPRQLLP